LETVALVKGDVPRIRRLEVSQHTVLVAASQGVMHERPAKALVLRVWVYADQWQVPVGLVRMRFAHFLEGRQQVVQVLVPCGLAEYLLECFAVGVHTGRQPERRTAKVGGHISRPVLEAAAGELEGG